MTATEDQVNDFISRWSDTGGGERSGCQSFLKELCRLLDVEEPSPPVEDEQQNTYIFERKVTVRQRDGSGRPNWIDLYKKGCFVLEAKQSARRREHLAELARLGVAVPEERTGSGKRGGTGWDSLMRSAREQAERYARHLPDEEGWPPFLIVVDIGHVIELFADFGQQGKHYAQFPDRQSYRIYLEDLRDDKIRERLRLVWTSPQKLDPARISAKVTREIAELLAKLSASLETRLIRALPPKQAQGEQTAARHAIAGKVALFLMRSLFTMFAEDIGLLGRSSFTKLLKQYRGRADKIHIPLQRLWQDMNTGGFSPELGEDVKRFNGGLFREATALEITEDELHWLTIAAERDWQDVEPAIFGTLLEQALDPRERHRLGAHYTPRVYAERLVVETIIDPLRRDWRDAQTAAALAFKAGKTEDARAIVRDFHTRLCAIKILDPACGTGNFLYVSMELLKRLEGDVLQTLEDMGEDQYLLEMDRHTVDPHQFLGMEINPRAVPIAELVLWIGYLQWHFRTRGGKVMSAEPILKNFTSIREQDAILNYDKRDFLRDSRGVPVTRWDGVTFKLHPVTGRETPDEDARTPFHTYANPRPAAWPEADFIVGNPPFIGGKDMRRELGDGYAEACWKARPKIPGGADFVMHFWDKAAATVRAGKARRFGLITTSSITQKFSRRVVENHLRAKQPLSLSLVMAIPDHPWVKSADSAAVRIAVTVGEGGAKDGVLRTVIREDGLNTDAPDVRFSNRRGKINADFTIGADITRAVPLRASEKISSRGVSLHGSGFIVTPEEAAALGLGEVAGLDSHILPYRNGRDLSGRPRGVMVIDLFGLTPEEVKDRFPAVYQRVVDRVKPERDQNNRKSYRENWWVFGEPRTELRAFLNGLPRYIATVETSKRRFFQFLDAAIRPDNKLINIGTDDAFHLGVLSSRFHTAWSLAAGGTLGEAPVYVKTRCFDPFPFPDPDEDNRQRIRQLAEQLDKHRKDVLEQHGHLTMTGLYRVLERVRAGDDLTDTDRDVYDAGLVGVLRQIHDDLDMAVALAYGWPDTTGDDEILEKLVALNHERAQEEAAGHIRWLRPGFQAPDTVARAAREQEAQLAADLTVDAGTAKKPLFPARSLPDQVAMVRALLSEAETPVSAQDLSRRFRQGIKVEARVQDVLKTLTLLGQADQSGDTFTGIE